MKIHEFLAWDIIFKMSSRVKPSIQALRLKSGGTPLCRELFFFNEAFMCTANVPEVPEIIPL